MRETPSSVVRRASSAKTLSLVLGRWLFDKTALGCWLLALGKAVLGVAFPRRELVGKGPAHRILKPVAVLRTTHDGRRTTFC
jgi:hypothetical protein